VLSINLQTEYLANERVTITDEALVPQRDNATLNFSGGGTLNLPLGRKGTLSGDLSRSYRADRSTLFQAGVPQLPARSEFDYWNGRLELTWQL
jgi:hypothetical protein